MHLPPIGPSSRIRHRARLIYPPKFLLNMELAQSLSFSTPASDLDLPLEESTQDTLLRISQIEIHTTAKNTPRTTTQIPPPENSPISVLANLVSSAEPTPSIDVAEQESQASQDHDYAAARPHIPVISAEDATDAAPPLPDLDLVLRSFISLINNIPFACRDAVADLISIHLDRVNHSPTFSNYHIFSLIPKLVLFSPVKRGKKFSQHLKTIIMDRIRRFHAGDYISLPINPK